LFITLLKSADCPIFFKLLTILLIPWLVSSLEIPIFLFIGSESSSQRVGYVNNYLSANGYWCSIFIPLLFTVIYLVIMPILTGSIRYYRRFISKQEEQRIKSLDIKLNQNAIDKFNYLVKIVKNFDRTVTGFLRVSGEVLESENQFKRTAYNRLISFKENIQDLNIDNINTKYLDLNDKDLLQEDS
jgi:uncharacterized membrane protein YciS (DUF1049 family)